MDQVRDLTRLALLLAMATVIHTAEAMLPLNFAWFRFGFANIIGIATLYMFGFRSAVCVTLGRIFIGSLISGSFGSPAFVLSLSGGILAIGSMGIFKKIGSRFFSEVGTSLVGATGHNIGQLLAAYLVIIRNDAIILILPFMLAAAAITGLINGLAARALMDHFRASDGNWNHGPKT